MAIKKYTTEEFVAALAALLQEHMDGVPATGSSPTPATTKGGKGKPKASKVADDDDEVDADDAAERRAELEAMTIAALRKLAVKSGFDKDEVTAADKEEIIESLLADEEEDLVDDEEEEDEDEVDEEDDDAGEYDRDELMELGLRELKALAKEEADLTAADMKGWDKEQVVDAILGESADEDEDDEDDEDVEDDEGGYDRDELEEMSLGELKALAKEWDIRLRPGMAKAKIIDALMDDGE